MNLFAIKIVQRTQRTQRIHNRAQIEGTVVIYVLAIFIASLVLLFGYTVVRNLSESARSIELLEFKQDLATAIKEKSSEFESRDTLTLSIPSDFETICFVGNTAPASATAAAATAQGYLLVAYLLNQNPPTPHNVFLLQQGLVRDTVSVGKLSLYDGTAPVDLRCIPIVDGSVTLTFVARGKEGVNILE